MGNDYNKRTVRLKQIIEADRSIVDRIAAAFRIVYDDRHSIILPRELSGGVYVLGKGQGQAVLIFD